MTIRHLRIFIEAAGSGDIISAASKLNMTQSAVDQTIKELEAHYDVLLFERLSKRLYITEAGYHLLSYARQVLAQFDVLEENMQKENRTETLRIGASLTIGESILPGIIRDFGISCPLVAATAYVANTPDIENKIADMALDVAVTDELICRRDIRSVPVIDDRLVLACSINHPFAGLKALSSASLANEKFALPGAGSGTRALFKNYLNTHKIDIYTALEASSPDAVIRSVLENNYLTVISARLIEKEIQNGHIYIFTNKTNAWDRAFSFVYHKDKVLTPSIHRLKSIIKTYNRTQTFDNISHGELL